MKKVTAKDPMFNNIKIGYKTGKIKVEVVANLMFNQFKWENKVDKKWIPFLKFLKQDRLAGFLLLWNIYDVLSYYYGRCDFKFTGNREYRNWIVENDGVYFILSSKSEVLLPYTKVQSENFYNAVVSCQYELFNMTLKFYKNNPDIYQDEDGYLKKHIEKWEKQKIIVENKFVIV